MSKATAHPASRCPGCGHLTPLAASCNQILTVEAIGTFLAGKEPTSRCESCGEPLDLSPCIVCADGWTGVVLGNKERLTVHDATDVVVTLLEGLPEDYRSRQLPILVVGRTGQLRRILRLGPKERFHAVRFDYLTCRDWVNQLESLMVLFDCYLQSEQPHKAFDILFQACQWMNELALHPRIYEAMDLAVEVATRNSASSDALPAVIQKLQAVHQVFQAFQARQSLTMNNVHLCFFHGESDFTQGDLIIYLVQLVPIDSVGRTDFESAELHVAPEPMQAIFQPKPTVLECAMLEMFVIGNTPLVPAQLMDRLSPEDKTLLQDTRWIFATHWELLGPSERYQLYKTYREKSGGRDLVMDFHLPPLGIYLTIDRMESGGDPRF